MYEKTDGGVNRRQFLRTTTLAAGSGSLAVGTTAAKQPAAVGEVHFVEMGIEHDIDVPSSDAFVVPSIETDEAPGHSVDPEGAKLELTRFAPPSARALFGREKTVLKVDRYRPFTAREVDTSPTAYFIDTDLTSDYRPVRSLALAEPRRRPGVDVTARDSAVEVTVDGTPQTVDEGAAKAFSLPERTVEILAEQQVETDASHAPPEKRAKTSWTEFPIQVTTRPRVKARNYGKLTVFDTP